MPSTFFGLDIAQTGLAAAKTMIDVAGQNIANDATPGYSRQVANLAASTAYAQPDLSNTYVPGQLGTGVDVQSITRVRASYLDGIYRSTQADNGLYSTRSNLLQAVQSLFNEPGSSGLSTTLNTFFSDWQTLSQNPSSPADRTVVQQDGQAVAAQIQSISQGLQSVAGQASNQATADVSTVNTYLQEIAKLNQSIANAQAVGQNPNDLLDKRDLTLDKLSKLIGIQTTTTTTSLGPNNITQVQVTVQGASGPVVLVQGNKSGSLSLTGGASGLTLTATDTSGATHSVSPTEGTIGAAYQLVNVDLNPNYTGSQPSLAVQFNQFVQQLTSAVNTQQEQGYYLDPTTSAWTKATNVPFFTASGGAATLTAANIQENPQIQGNTQYIAAGQTPNSGDGQNAAAVANIAQPTSGPLAQYASFVASIGSQVDLAQNLQGTAQSLATQITNQRQQTAGVSINEEMGTMVQAQSMYTAAAKVAQAVNSMLQTLLAAVQP